MEAALFTSQISQAQRKDPILSAVIKKLEANKHSTRGTGQWTKFPLRCYQQIWSQLTLQETVLCRKVKSPTMSEEKLLIVIPYSLRKEFLAIAHDKAGHQGTDRTFSQLSQIAYWVGMSKEVTRYCSYCTRCQYTKSPPNQPAPLQPVIASRPWELVAVDILKVPMSP